MSPQTFDRDTWLDLSVNLVPLGILLFFIAVFLALMPWGFDSVVNVEQFALVGVPFLLLAVVTYYAGRAIYNAERAEDNDA
ncbi:MAG: DUF6684 family protein [Haloarculaceae archaeon]